VGTSLDRTDGVGPVSPHGHGPDIGFDRDSQICRRWDAFEGESAAST
jgi:hypothetical protein